MKFVLGLSYDGSKYYGWQKQNNLLTVQGCLEKVLSQIANHNINIFCAGRTDRGVHGIEQIVHFETYSLRSEKEWLIGSNSLLPKDITISWLKKVSFFFHARFSALSRSYRYIIFNNIIRSSFLENYCYYIYPILNTQLMHKAAQKLIGEHDFFSFQSSGCQSITSQRNIFLLNVYKRDKFIIIDIKANSFLYHMVRNIVGCLIMIGLSHKKSSWIYQLLQYKKNQKEYMTVPPNGLYFLSAEYPKKFFYKKNIF